MSEPKNEGDEPRESYDFSGAVRGKHAARFRGEAPVTLLIEEPTRLPDSEPGFPSSVAPRFPLRDRPVDNGPHYQVS